MPPGTIPGLPRAPVPEPERHLDVPGRWSRKKNGYTRLRDGSAREAWDPRIYDITVKRRTVTHVIWSPHHANVSFIARYVSSGTIYPRFMS